MGELDIFAARMREIRERKNMNQKQFANLLGIKQQTLSGYERGTMKPPLDVAKGIAEKLCVSLDWLCGIDQGVRTYADMFRLIDKLCNPPTWTLCEWTIQVDTTPIPGTDEAIQNATIQSHDKDVLVFFDSWEKMQQLLIEGTIDKKLYDLWLNDKLKYYENKPLSPFPSDVEEELPSDFQDLPKY